MLLWLKERYWMGLAQGTRSLAALQRRLRRPVLSNRGWCPTCDREVTFAAYDPWLRDHYLCSHCGSIPRERALMLVIERLFPRWRELAIHESSPVRRGASARLAQLCPGYLASQYFPDRPRGTTVDGVRCEDLETMSFADESFDLHVTQDVLEHVFEPARVFREIARTLKPGGAHVFAVPIVRRGQPSVRRARRDADGTIKHLAPAQFHGSPVSAEGALVTMDWGFDICRHICEPCGLFTHVFCIDDLTRGIRAEYIEVLVTQKPPRDGEGPLP